VGYGGKVYVVELSIQNPRTRKIYLLIWAGSFLTFGLYARIANIGTGQWLILGSLVLIFLGLVGMVLALHEEMGRAGKGGPYDGL
jgi:hypothetical protein